MQTQTAVEWQAVQSPWMREPVRSVARRLERYFDWYFRYDPDMPREAALLVTRFLALARGRVDAREAKKLLDESRGFALGSPWEEMRAALKVLARS